MVRLETIMQPLNQGRYHISSSAIKRAIAQFILLISLVGFAGFPATITPGSTSLMTTAPMPIVAPSPIHRLYDRRIWIDPTKLADIR